MNIVSLPTRPDADAASLVADVMHARRVNTGVATCYDHDDVMEHVADILRGIDDPTPEQIEQAAEEALRGLDFLR